MLAQPKTNAFALGDFTQPGARVALIGLALVVFLQGRKLPGAILWAILAATLAGIPLGVTKLPAALMSWPHSMAPVAFQLDIGAALTVTAAQQIPITTAAVLTFSITGTGLTPGERIAIELTALVTTTCPPRTVSGTLTTARVPACRSVGAYRTGPACVGR